MKTKHLFWGFLFITLGALILVNNFTRVNIYWFNIWQFWPLFLILLGISLLIKQEIIRSVLVSITAVILGISIFATIKTGWGFFHEDVRIDFTNGIHIRDIDKRDLETQVFEEDINQNVKFADLHFKAGAGSFKISDTTSKLFSAITKCYDNDYSLTRKDEGDNVKLHFENDHDGFMLFRGKNKNNVRMSFSDKPIWKMYFDVGAAASEFDLKYYKVEDLDINIGAASLKIALGDLLDSVNVNIDAGASSIEVLVPENVGCEVIADVVLSKKDFEGFNKIRKNLYRTGNFESSAKKIYLDIDTGVSSIKIKRYSNSEW